MTALELLGAPRQRARWRLRDPEAAAFAIPRYPPIVAQVLSARGIRTREAAEQFYKPHLTPDDDPLLLPGMAEAVARVREAIARSETIALYGDFDVDGVTSLALLTLALQPLGAKTLPYIPDRFQEGYGLNTGAIAHLHGQGTSLLITADCGISSVLEVDYANALGLDVIILDHHTVPEAMPAALAAVNPKRLDSPYPFTELAAVGVAFRFVQVLYEAMGRPFAEHELLDLVALGTVVDVAPLAAENRRIVTAGLERMREGLRPGLEALAAVAGAQAGRFEAQTLGFTIGPRLNAPGRLQHARLSLALLLEGDPLAAKGLAQQLNDLNRQRQEQTVEAYALAEELLALGGRGEEPLIMIGSKDFPAGIVGLVAGRLAERRSRPAIVYTEGPETSRASARSIPAFDIVAAIRKERHLLERHGGHRAAAGFTVRNEHLADLRERLVNTAAEQLDERDFTPVINVDVEAPLSALTGIEVKGLMRFEPCGQGNSRPVLLSRGVRLLNTKAVGADKDHLRLTVKDGLATWPGIAFRQADTELAGEVDIVYTLGKEWRTDRVELEVLDITPSALRRPLELVR